jgi:hypothetical protein
MMLKGQYPIKESVKQQARRAIQKPLAQICQEVIKVSLVQIPLKMWSNSTEFYHHQ